MKKVLCVFTVVLFTSLSATSTATAQVPSEPAPDQIAILSAQLELMKDHYDNILQTIHWSFAIIVGLVIALLAFAYFLNIRVYERDKENLESTLSSGLQTGLLHLESELKELISKSISNEIEERTAYLDTKVDSTRDRLISQMKEINGELVFLKYQGENYQANEFLRKKDKYRALNCYIEALKDSWIIQVSR